MMNIVGYNMKELRFSTGNITTLSIIDSKEFNIGN